MRLRVELSLRGPSRCTSPHSIVGLQWTGQNGAWTANAHRELRVQALPPQRTHGHSPQVERLVPRRGSAVLGGTPWLPLSRDSGPAASARGRHIENQAIRYRLDTS